MMVARDLLDAAVRDLDAIAQGTGFHGSGTRKFRHQRTNLGWRES